VARRALALAAAGLVAAVVLGPLVAVLDAAGGAGGLVPADLAALRFTLVQAAWSAALSVLLAIPVARALARRRFPGRAAIVTALGAPFLLPALVGALGVLAVWGRSGLVADALGTLGLGMPSIYGLQGVVLASVFLNLPLAVRLLLQGWTAIPAERFRLAASLGAGPWDAFRLLERPMLRVVVPGAAAVVFLVCLTSFAVALTLGGGPGATTLELAIYEAFVFSFDLPRAAALALVQTGLGLAAAALGMAVALPSALAGGLGRPVERWDAAPPALDAAWIAAAVAFLGLPLLAIVADGVPRLPTLPGSVWLAAGRSVAVAVAAAALCVGLALTLAVATRGRWAEGVAALGLAVSPLAIGTGLFLMVNAHLDPSRVALPVTALVNALAALPFALRALLPAAREAEADHGRLASSLGMQGVDWLRLVLLPRMRRPLGFAAGLAAALSMGDLGVVTLFAAQDATLPLQMYRLMGAYRMEDAAGASLLLMALALGLFAVCDGWGRRAPA
jgi:thiamine transport system permease protein